MWPDVSIYDYANANVAGRRGRLSKGVNSPIQEAVQRLSHTSNDISWVERLEGGDGEEDDEEEVGTKVLAVPPSGHDGPAAPFLELPLDIWFAVSEHIDPEDVGVFACICKSAYLVTKSARFWFSLYRRYYSKTYFCQLPDRLKPECIMRRHGLRAYVVRSLYFMYSPFIERMKSTKRSECDLQPLLRRRCISMWYAKSKSWVFCFKLKRIDPRAERSVSRTAPVKSNFFKELGNIYANEEKDCKVLQVSCSNYLPLPAAHGHILTRALSTVTQDMMANKISLTFSNGMYVVLDPATNVQILDWWHPQYPHPQHPQGLTQREVKGDRQHAQWYELNDWEL